MSHAVYTTDALVLGSAPVQDADKLLWLLTEDFGLIFASAKSVRKETSKLRYALQDLSRAQVSLVRGRGLWRVTGALREKEYVFTTEQQELCGRIASLLRRVMPTDEQNQSVFHLMSSMYVLLENESRNTTIETLVVARILYRLGYVFLKPAYVGVVDIYDFSNKTLEGAQRIEGQLVHDINTGLSESQL